MYCQHVAQRLDDTGTRPSAHITSLSLQLCSQSRREGFLYCLRQKATPSEKGLSKTWIGESEVLDILNRESADMKPSIRVDRRVAAQ